MNGSQWPVTDGPFQEPALRPLWFSEACGAPVSRCSACAPELALRWIEAWTVLSGWAFRCRGIWPQEIEAPERAVCLSRCK